MNATGRAWEASIAKGKPDEKMHAEAAQFLAEIRPLEDYWAFPGSRLMATISEALEQRNAAVFARLVQKTSNALLTGSYRYESAAWDPLQEGEGSTPDILPPDVKPGESHKPYFEVLVVTVNLLHYLAKNVMVGGECLWGKLEENDGKSGHDNRIQFSSKFNF